MNHTDDCQQFVLTQPIYFKKQHPLGKYLYLQLYYWPIQTFSAGITVARVQQYLLAFHNCQSLLQISLIFKKTIKANIKLKLQISNSKSVESAIFAHKEFCVSAKTMWIWNLLALPLLILPYMYHLQLAKRQQRAKDFNSNQSPILEWNCIASEHERKAQLSQFN